MNDNSGLDPASGVSVTIQTPGTEGHVSITATKTASTSIPEIIQGMKEIKSDFENWVIDKILEIIP